MRVWRYATIVGLVLIGLSASAQTVVTKLELTDAQRIAIREAVSGQPHGRGPDAELRPTVGTPLPPSAQLYALPDATVAAIPLMRVYRYTMIGDDVVIVDPDTRMVVEIIRK